ncbi:sororin [Hirundo rustica]|uniref:sororin n=1 Tax=Hirundo rustica TaxID=43150 RepID=UPI002670FF7B|nr:sororin [Hirundo rustica]
MEGSRGDLGLPGSGGELWDGGVRTGAPRSLCGVWGVLGDFGCGGSAGVPGNSWGGSQPPLSPPIFPPRHATQLQALGGLGPPGGAPVGPLVPQPLGQPRLRPTPTEPPAPPEPPQIPPLDLPGIGGGPERRKKKKVTPIDLLELEAWAASMNAQFEEAERFHLVVE